MQAFTVRVGSIDDIPPIIIENKITSNFYSKTVQKLTFTPSIKQWLRTCYKVNFIILYSFVFSIITSAFSYMMNAI
ncbi:hypothetical protein ATO46_02740 [Aeromonas schubertii]|nr:hypothetical protein ATO46_02740 [Aeromonas schubertii]